jgi:hypothetical protein
MKSDTGWLGTEEIDAMKPFMNDFMNNILTPSSTRLRTPPLPPGSTNYLMSRTPGSSTLRLAASCHSSLIGSPCEQSEP